MKRTRKTPEIGDLIVSSRVKPQITGLASQPPRTSMVDTESFEKFEHIDATNSKTLFFSDLLRPCDTVCHRNAIHFP